MELSNNLDWEARSEYSSFGDFPPVSIIIVNYNGYRWLKLCLNSLVNTNYSKFEILIVDNGSTDSSIEYLRNNWQHQVRIIEVKENAGFAEGCNIGINQANGSIIALLNNDIEVDSNWLNAAVETLLSDRETGAVQSKMMRYDDKRRIDCAGLSVDSFGLCIQIGFGEEDHGQYNNLHEIWGCCGGAMVAWKDVLIEAGLFDRAFFMYYEDVDLCWRIKLLGYKILLSPSSMVYHIGSATTQTVPSSFATFHLTKNYISSWLKNYELKSLILKLPINILIVGGGLLFEIVYRRFGLFNARFKSTIWVIRNLNYILKERHKVQSFIRKKHISDKLLFIKDKKKGNSNLLNIIKIQSQKAKNANKNPFSRS